MRPFLVEHHMTNIAALKAANAHSTGATLGQLERLIDEGLQGYAYSIKGEVNRYAAKSAKQQGN